MIQTTLPLGMSSDLASLEKVMGLAGDSGVRTMLRTLRMAYLYGAGASRLRHMAACAATLRYFPDWAAPVTYGRRRDVAVAVRELVGPRQYTPPSHSVPKEVHEFHVQVVLVNEINFKLKENYD